MLCGECKHWDRGPHTGNVSNPRPGEGYCWLLSDSAYDEDALAYVAFNYDLFTKPTFGCVLGEKK